MRIRGAYELRGSVVMGGLGWAAVVEGLSHPSAEYRRPVAG